MENLAKFPHCILLTRSGQFYEVNSIVIRNTITADTLPVLL